MEAQDTGGELNIIALPTSSILTIQRLIGVEEGVPLAFYVRLINGDFYTVDLGPRDANYTGLLELIGDPDMRVMSDGDLQHELELAERRHTRILAEVARRSP